MCVVEIGWHVMAPLFAYKCCCWCLKSELQVILPALYFVFAVIQVFESSKQDHTRSWLYGLCSLSYLGAMVSSNSALQYVNYPTQVCTALYSRVSVSPLHNITLMSLCSF